MGRVGFLTPWNQSCGLATYAKFLVSELERQGLDFVVFAETGESTTAKDEPFVRRCWRRVSAAAPIPDYFELRREIKQAGISTLHINCQARFFALAAFRDLLASLRACDVRIVVQLHNLFSVSDDLAILVTHADRVFVHTSENRLEAIANGAAPAHVTVVPHGIVLRPQTSHQDRGSIRASLGVQADEPLLITFGFIQPHKGLEALIEAVTHLRQRGIAARGVIIGETRADDPNSAAYMRALRDLVNRSGVTEHVTFIATYVPEEQVGDFLAAADIVIMNYRSQHFEASGACSLAVGAGAAVITSLAPAMMSFGDAVWHSTSGYPVGLSAELLLTNTQLRDELKRRAITYAQANSWEQIASKVIGQYRDMQQSPLAVQQRRERRKEEKSNVTHSLPLAAARPMRILIQNRPNTFTQRGGDTVVLEELSKGLAIRGHEVVVDVEGNRDPRGYDLVHLFNFATPQLTQALAQRAQAANVPFVVTSLYEDVPEFHNQSHALAGALVEYVRGGQRREYWLNHKGASLSAARSQRFPCDWLVQHAAAIFANGAGEASALKRDFPQCSTIIEVPVGHETGVKGDAALFEGMYGVRDFVLCVGRLESRKNQLMLLKALEESEITVVLAAGGFSYQPEYENAVRSFKRRGQTLILDRLSAEMLAAAYAACRIHALPSWYELPGLVSLEAASFGKNIVVTRTGTSADYMKDVAFFCAPADEDSIFSAVMAAYHSPARPKLVETALAYTWESAVEETVSAYQAVLGIQVKIPAAQPSSACAATAAPAGIYDMSFNAMELEDAIEQGEAAAKALDFGRAEELLRRADAFDSGSPRAAKSLAAVLLAQSRVDEARPLFDKALRLSPGDPKALAGRGMCETMSDRPEAALLFFDKALDIAPDTLVALYQVIECAYKLDRYDRAEASIRRYLAVVPADTEIRFCLAGCLYKSGELKACLREVLQVLSEKPQHEGGLELQVRVQAELAAQEAVQVCPSQPEALQTALLLSPEGLEDLSHRIQAWTVGGASLMTASAEMATDADRQSVGDAATRAQDVATIIADLEALKRAGKVTEANEMIANTPSAAAGTAEQREVLGCLRAELAVLDGKLTEAAAMYDVLLDRNPHLARALCGKGALAAESQDWTTAQAFFETSLDYNSSYDVALAGLGLCRMVKGRSEEAFALFKQAATANPENHRAILGVLQLGYPLKRYAEMEAMVLSYLQRYPASLDMIYSFAGLLYAQGRVHEARTEVQKILIVEPKHEPALELREMLEKVDSGPELVM